MCQRYKSLEVQGVMTHIKGKHMSKIEIQTPKNDKYSTNTISEPVYMCIGGKKYVVDDGFISKYSVYKKNGFAWIDVEDYGKFPIIEIK